MSINPNWPRLQALWAPAPVDVNALGAAVAAHLASGGSASADAIAAAVAKHFATALAAS